MSKLTLAGVIATQLMGALMTPPLSAETVSFEADPVGSPPRRWLLTMTGKGTPKWTVERDEGGAVVLMQSGRATYPLALKLRRGEVQAHFGEGRPGRRHCLAGEGCQQLLRCPRQCPGRQRRALQDGQWDA